MNKTIYFISRETKGSRYNPYFMRYDPVVAVSETLEMAQKFCQNQLNYLKGNYELSGFFTAIETNNPLIYKCKYDYQNHLTLEIREEIVTEQKYNEWINNTKPYYLF